MAAFIQSDIYLWSQPTNTTYTYPVHYYSRPVIVDVPYPRNRLEKKILKSISNEKYLRYIKAVKSIYGDYHFSCIRRETWNCKFWSYVIHKIPSLPKKKILKIDRPGTKPSGQSERIRTCSSRWIPIRS